MKNKTFFIALLVLIFAAFEMLLPENIWPDNSKTFGPETVNSIQVKSSLKLFGTTVKESTEVEGHFYCENAHTGMLLINGSAEIVSSTIGSRAAIKGELSIIDSNFIENLEFTGKKLQISSSVLNSIFIFAPEDFSGELILELDKNTLLKGSVIFQGARGKVLLKNQSQINGQIVGGERLNLPL